MKTFTSAWPNHPRRINVRETEDGVNVSIADPLWDSKRGITLAPSDAPALCLAILEAAGHVRDACSDNDADVAMEWLHSAIARQAKQSAEAKEQAELEAEALDFLNVSREAKHLGPLDNFDEHTKDAWLAVARRAREMRAEK